MGVIHLTHKDINEMVHKAVRGILRETVQETMGSSMVDKEDVIQDIVNYIKYEWARIQEENVKPNMTDEFEFNHAPGDAGKIYTYIILLPDQLTKKLDLADEFDVNVAIQNFVFDPKYLKYFGANERGTEGQSYNGGGKFDRLNKTTMRMRNGRIDLTVPAVLGELQTKDMHSTLYHELNHSFTGLQIKKKVSDLPDDEVDRRNTITMSARAGNHPHGRIMRAMRPDPITDFLNSITYGKHSEEYRALNFVLYAIWERTERNARAEAIYGDLKELHATRATFSQAYPQTSVARNINELNGLLDKLRKVPAHSMIWDYAATMMNMNARGKNKNRKNTESFYEKVKERFITRSEQLLDILYRRAMKVAELYFQRNEPRKEPTRFERYKQERDK